MEDRTLLAGLVSLFIFAAIMGGVTFTGQVTVDQGTGTECTEDWSCDDWSECLSYCDSVGTDCNDGIQVRNCTDQNACGTTDNKPSEQQDCEVPKEWHTLDHLRFVGDSDQKTSMFSMPFDVWRLSWVCSDLAGEDNEGKGFASIRVYDNFDNRVASDSGNCNDIAERGARDVRVDGKGGFYISVDTLDLDHWSIQLEAEY
jgi:hypothetical protein